METEVTLNMPNTRPSVNKLKLPIKGMLVPNGPLQGYTSLVNKHRRAGSTGTTGDESYTTDEEEIDEPDCSVNSSYENVNIVRNGMFAFDDDFHSISSNGAVDDQSLNINLSQEENTCDIRNSTKKECLDTKTNYRIDDTFRTENIIRNKISQLADKHSVLHKSSDSGPGDLLQDTSNMSSLENGDKDKISWESLSTESDSTKDFTEIMSKEEALSRLQDQLKTANEELKLRDAEVSRLTRIRNDVEAELEDLTASLFQEAHTMVREANVNQAAAEKSLKESEMKVEVLTAEVAALKTLVLTSTPSCPNPHLHPQISPRVVKEDIGGSVFTKKHYRSPSHFNLKYGREASPPDSPVKEQRAASSLGTDTIESKEGFEVDPNIHKEFLAWKQNPKMDKNDPFICRIYNEDINMCLNFNNEELSKKLMEAVDNGNIFIEAISDKAKTLFPKKCALLEVPRLCSYRMKLGDQDVWHNISQICRNRIIAVCDFLNYLRYIERGLVKSSAHEVYWEMMRLRKEMVLARLGLPLSV